jgi:hypothetical protein
VRVSLRVSLSAESGSMGIKAARKRAASAGRPAAPLTAAGRPHVDDTAMTPRPSFASATHLGRLLTRLVIV